MRVRTGHDFSDYKRAAILRRLGRRMQVNGIQELPAYLVFLRTHLGEVGALLQDLLISVTNFFRDHDAFQALEAEIPRLFRGKKSCRSGARVGRRLRHRRGSLLRCYAAFRARFKAEGATLAAGVCEELRSATEEVETSREELQSINEELSTFNQELKSKVEELGKANTERKAAEDARTRLYTAFAAAQEHLRLVFENAREYAIFSIDRERRVTSWNAGAERLLGFSESEVSGKLYDEIFIPEDRAAGIPEREAARAIAEGHASDEAGTNARMAAACGVAASSWRCATAAER